MILDKIKTKRLILIKRSLRYLDDFHEMLNNKKVLKALGKKEKTSKQQLKKDIIKVQRRWREGKQYSFIIIYENKMIGTIGIFNIDYKKKAAEVGYVFNYEYWNQGFATESLKAVVNFSFNKIKLKRVYADFGGYKNSSSEKVLKKCGFKKDRTQKEIVYFIFK